MRKGIADATDGNLEQHHKTIVTAKWNSVHDYIPIIKCAEKFKWILQLMTMSLCAHANIIFMLIALQTFKPENPKVLN